MENSEKYIKFASQFYISVVEFADWVQEMTILWAKGNRFELPFQGKRVTIPLRSPYRSSSQNVARKSKTPTTLCRNRFYPPPHRYHRSLFRKDAFLLIASVAVFLVRS